MLGFSGFVPFSRMAGIFVAQGAFYSIGYIL
jgi:hypothetical protein